jgi:hypothetical protein
MRDAMNEHKNNPQVVLDEIHAILEKSLIEAYLKGKGYGLDDLKTLPEEKASQLRREASTYASNKLAEMELKAHFRRVLHDAYTDE